MRPDVTQGRRVVQEGGRAMPIAAVIFNPTKIGRDALAEVVDPALSAAGWGEAQWFETAVDSPGTEQARAAVAQGCDVVLAVGGDGTVRGAAQGLEGSGVPLGLVARGTGNLLAHELGLSINDLAAAVDTALNGGTRAIDLGVVDWTREDESKERHVFVVMAGMGLDAQIMATTDPVLKEKVGILAYVKAGIVALFKDRRMELKFQVDGGASRVTRVHTVLVGNVGTIFRNVTVMPDSKIDDGALDLVAVRPLGPLGWLSVGWRVLVDNRFFRRLKPPAVRERDDSALELRYRQCRHIDVVLREPEEIELDGDHFGKVRAVSIGVAAGALLVKVPAVG
ncbi:Diacylglycerol kinase family enzyme [Tessaracoccus bendigoensis DSM 12906]|uniref:Diacylglycerol kinase family enzyme n=1 Tax=Tessaracoccus bendigoensis DSM 12906 TaxID=1123357 RepID=A0A1M6MF66_9ACTN|nr:diacylglycerol kinase family protein [Tessaracoccus bendigoensis]SHJ82105.1 Diacylglycerol kinase family enzyme [Tessaracoccus bendigoensis DSM 12906]